MKTASVEGKNVGMVLCQCQTLLPQSLPLSVALYSPLNHHRRNGGKRCSVFNSYCIYNMCGVHFYIRTYCVLDNKSVNSGNLDTTEKNIMKLFQKRRSNNTIDNSYCVHACLNTETLQPLPIPLFGQFGVPG